MDVLVIASSSVDSGIGCWELQTGKEQMRYKTCSSPANGLAAVGSNFLAASQIREAKASSGSVSYWSWNKPQVEVKSFPEVPIKPLTANKEGTYIVGGASSGHIFLWEVATGRLLKKWQAHYRSVTCLVFSEDDSLLVSGSLDGSVRVWSLLRLFDDFQRQQRNHLYEYSFTEHTMPVTDIAMGYGGCNAIIVSASEDRTCKVWSMFKGTMLRTIVFPTAIDAIALEPAESVFYAGGRDGKIYIAALNAKSTSNNGHGMHIIGSLSFNSKAVTCLAYSAYGNLLLSGSEDGMVHVWDPKTRSIIRGFRHAKGPVNNICIVRRPISSTKTQTSSRKHGPSLPPPLQKYEVSADDEITDDRVIVNLPACDPLEESYLSSSLIENQSKELQQQGSAATEMEIERLKHDNKRSIQSIEQWKNMVENLQQFCVDELLDNDQTCGSN